MLKRFLLLIIGFILLPINFTYGENITKDSNYFSYMKYVINTENDLKETSKGEEYVELINNFIESASESVLNELYSRLEQIDLGELKSGLNKKIITYLKYRTYIAVNYKEITSEGYDNLNIYIITDKRDTQTSLDFLKEQLNDITSIQKANIQEFDFADDGIKEYLDSIGVNRLPLLMFSTNNFDVSEDEISYDYYGEALPSINYYLLPLSNGDYYLEVGATFNPFLERSDRGFLMISQENLDLILQNSYADGDSDSKFLWIEYSDLECPYCAKHHINDTQNIVSAEYEGEITQVFNHFPLSFHQNAETGAEVLECLAEQNGTDSFYSLLRTSFASAETETGGIDTSTSSSYDFLIEEAVNLGADKNQLETCVSESRYAEKIATQMQNGMDIFGVSGTPGNVLINTETLEYQVVSGAYASETFIEVIESLK